MVYIHRHTLRFRHLSIAKFTLPLVLVIVALALVPGAEARLYQWQSPVTGNMQMSGSPPSWYRSGQPGPRVLVFEDGFLVDDTQIEVSQLRRIFLRKAAFDEMEERKVEADLRQLKEDEQRRETAAAQALLANKRRAELTALLPAARKPDEMEADGNEGALPDNLSSDAVDRLKAIISAFDTLQQLGSGVEN